MPTLDKPSKSNIIGCQDRDKFNMGKYKKSALSMHAYDTHGGDLTLEDFSVAVFKKVPPRRLNREEFIFIDKYGTQRVLIDTK